MHTQPLISPEPELPVELERYLRGEGLSRDALHQAWPRNDTGALRRAYGSLTRLRNALRAALRAATGWSVRHRT